MEKIALLNLKGEKVKDIKLNENVFGIEPNNKVLYDAIILTRGGVDVQGFFRSRFNWW